MNENRFPDAVFAQASFQFCGHIDEYLIRHTRHLGLFYNQTRFGKGGHLLRIYENGELVEERHFASAKSIPLYYWRMWWNWHRELCRFARRHKDVTAIFEFPSLAAGRLFRRNVRHVFWQWDYFPGRGFTERLYDAVAWHYARRCERYIPLTSSIGRVMGLPDAKPLMLGVVPPTRFGNADSNRILMVGQLRGGQGIENILDFIAAHPQYSLSLMGAAANGFEKVIEERIAVAKMTDRVYFPNHFVTDAELREEAAKCFVSLALYDTSPSNLTHYADPGKVKSSIEMGLPVVMTRISDIVPFVEKFKAGEVVDSIAELSAVIDRIRSNYSEYQKGLQTFAAHFECERYYAECGRCGQLKRRRSGESSLSKCRYLIGGKNVLFIDHACHAKTKSFDFFRDLIATRHRTDTVYFERHYHCHVPAEKIAWADVVVFLEFIPFRFACGIPGKRCVYLPMYDNEWASKWHWRRLALLGMNVISFCRKVTEHARACGVQNVLDVRFAFDPEKFAGMAGDPRIASFWDRGDVSTETAKSLFEEGAVDEVMVKDGFLDDEGYRRFLTRPGVFVAPRRKEGIGMAFLEQVAMGKCVIAHDDATMNEYLEDGVTGVLMDMRYPRKVSAHEIATIRANMPTFAKSLYETWQRDIPRILDYFDRLVESAPMRTPWNVSSLIMYGFYWVEGMIWRLKN